MLPTNSLRFIALLTNVGSGSRGGLFKMVKVWAGLQSEWPRFEPWQGWLCWARNVYFQGSSLHPGVVMVPATKFWDGNLQWTSIHYRDSCFMLHWETGLSSDSCGPLGSWRLLQMLITKMYFSHQYKTWEYSYCIWLVKSKRAKCCCMCMQSWFILIVWL